VPEGKTMDEAVFNDFLIDHPMIKFPYITNGEITAEQVMQLAEKCNGLFYTP
jgi:beta-glucosidase